MMPALISASSLGVSVAIVFATAVLRGYTGFGFAVIAVPLLVLLLEPAEVVPTVLLLEVVASLQLLPSVWRSVDWWAVRRLLIGALAGTPLGILVLSQLPGREMRLGIAGVVLLTALSLAAGLQFRSVPGRLTTITVGLLSGALNGAVAMSGPPVVLFFLSTPASLMVGRASLVMFFTLADTAATGFAAVAGLVTGSVLATAAALAPALFLGQAIGSRFFDETKRTTFQRVSLGIMVLVSVLVAAQALRD